jgi:hypothetical protein
MSATTTVLLAALLAVLLIVSIFYLAFHLRFERWKRDYTKEVRRDAVHRSQAATLGKVYEHLIPYLPDFRWNPKDARFLGTPVDFLIFDGLSEGHVRAVVFVEVKTGTSRRTLALIDWPDFTTPLASPLPDPRASRAAPGAMPRPAQ